MSRMLNRAALALAIFVLPLSAQAHRAWFLPSATVLSGNDPWLTVDAAISNDLFYFEHMPMRLGDLVVTAPDGSTVAPQNASTGRYRSTFDVQLTQQGTYKVASVSSGLNARYKLGTESKRWRGSAAELPTAIPAGATDVEVSESVRRIETFATLGKPTLRAIEPTGVGLEFVPVTHPNDLYAGEEAKFRLLLDGKPAAGLEVEVVPGGIRYRDRLNELKLVTDADGGFAVTWPAPGMYWLSASVRDAAGTIANARRSLTWVATLEVLRP